MACLGGVRTGALDRVLGVDRGLSGLLCDFVVGNVAQDSTTGTENTKVVECGLGRNQTIKLPDRGQYRIAVASGESRGSSSCQHFETHPTLPRFGTDLFRIADLPTAL